MRTRRLYLAATLLVAALLALTIAACTLNPQPLPPGFEGEPSDIPAADSGGFGTADGQSSSDAAAPEPEEDSGSRDDDGGDAGDASDAGPADGGDAGDASQDGSG